MAGFKLKGRFMQYLAAILVSTFTMTSFMSVLWSSPVSELLRSEDTPLDKPLNLHSMGYLYLTLMVGSVLGNVCMGFLINQFGRRGTLLISCCPTFISWVMIYFGTNITTVLVARFLMGLTVNFPILVAVMYISEIVESNIRGKLSVFCLLSAEIGAILTFSVGPYSYHGLALIGIFISILAFSTFYFMPETPFYLLKKMRYQDAEDSLKRLRDADNVSEELKEMTIAVEESERSQSSLKDIIGTPSYRKAFLIVLGLKTLQEICGGHFIQAYMTTIFALADTGLDENVQSLLSILVTFPFMIATSYLVDRFGRKFLLYISTIGTAVGMTLESIFFFLQATDSTTDGMKYLPVTGIFIVYVFKAMGIGSIPVLIMSELFPTNIKGLASATILVYGSLLGTLLTFVFMELVIVIGLQGCFLFYAVSCIFGFAFTLVCVPETKGKTLTEIHNGF